MVLTSLLLKIFEQKPEPAQDAMDGGVWTRGFIHLSHSINISFSFSTCHGLLCALHGNKHTELYPLFELTS